MNRHIGRFQISAIWIDQEDRPNIFDRCLVLHVEHDYARRVITYTAIHPSFDEVAEGQIAPMYEGIFSDGRRSPWWRRIAR
jgi:hypothetical protein